MKFVPLILIFGIVVFCWVFLFPYLNRKNLKRFREKSIKARGSLPQARKVRRVDEKIAGPLILSHRIERVIAVLIVIFLAIFGILYFLK